MSPQASTRVLAPEAKVPAPTASPSRRRRAGSWVEAMPGLCTTRSNDILRMSWRAQCVVRSKGQTPCPMVNISRAEGRPVVALHGRGDGGQHAVAKAVAEAGADFSALEFESLGEGKCVQPCRGRTARAAEQAGACSPPFCRSGVEGFQQGISAGLCRLP
jgi:hypothetical protein